MNSAVFWDKAAAKYAKDPIKNIRDYEQTRDRIREVLRPQDKVLELGCGTGTTALELADKVANYHATDFSKQMIAIAKEKQSAATPEQLRFSVGNTSNISSGSYDVVLALNLLHLLPHLDQDLAIIFEALPSGGKLIAKTGLLKDGPWYLRAILPLVKAIGIAPLVRNLSQGEMTDLLEKTGFEVSETLMQEGLVPRIFTIATKP